MLTLIPLSTSISVCRITQFPRHYFEEYNNDCRALRTRRRCHPSGIKKEQERKITKEIKHMMEWKKRWWCGAENEKSIDCLFSSSVLWLGLQTQSSLSFSSKDERTCTHTVAGGTRRGSSCGIRTPSPRSLLVFSPTPGQDCSTRNPRQSFPSLLMGLSFTSFPLAHRHQASANYAQPHVSHSHQLSTKLELG